MTEAHGVSALALHSPLFLSLRFLLCVLLPTSGSLVVLAASSGCSFPPDCSPHFSCPLLFTATPVVVRVGAWALAILTREAHLPTQNIPIKQAARREER